MAVYVATRTEKSVSELMSIIFEEIEAGRWLEWGRNGSDLVYIKGDGMQGPRVHAVECVDDVIIFEATDPSRSGWCGAASTAIAEVALRDALRLLPPSVSARSGSAPGAALVAPERRPPPGRRAQRQQPPRQRER